VIQAEPSSTVVVIVIFENSPSPPGSLIVGGAGTSPNVDRQGRPGRPVDPRWRGSARGQLTAVLPCWRPQSPARVRTSQMCVHEPSDAGAFKSRCLRGRRLTGAGNEWGKGRDPHLRGEPGVTFRRTWRSFLQSHVTPSAGVGDFGCPYNQTAEISAASEPACSRPACADGARLDGSSTLLPIAATESAFGVTSTTRAPWARKASV
jgi:hypothetical protein